MSNPTAMPAPTVTQEELNLWFETQKQISELKVVEMDLRKKIFASYFQAPVEGTNTAPLSMGWVLKGQYKIDRKVDEAMLLTLQPLFKEHKIPVKELVIYKPELALRVYRGLDEEQLKIFDQVLVIKPGSPSLEITKPKR
jgi:hypothetical protein